MLYFFNRKKFFGLKNRIYFDSASAVPVLDIAKKAYLETLASTFANASSIHAEGEKAKDILFEARKKVAKFIKCKSGEIFFTSSVTEANNIFIKGVVLASKIIPDFVSTSLKKEESKAPHIIFSIAEHSSISQVVIDSKNLGADYSTVKPNTKGVLEIENILKEIKENTKLICLSLVNSETGAIQDVRKIVLAIHNFCKEKNWSRENWPKVFVDATQAVKYENIDVSTLLVDGLSFSGSKIGSVPGCAVLFVRNGTKLKSIISGGGQEEGVRSGTENLPGIAALAEVLAHAQNQRSGKEVGNKEYVYSLRHYCIKRLEENFVTQKFSTDTTTNNLSSENPPKIELEIFGDTKFKYNKFFEHAAPHILLISLVDMLGEEILLRLDAKGISVSTASACSLLENSGSNFLRSIGEPVKAKETIRLSFSEKNTKAEIDYFVKALREIKDKFVIN